MGYMIEITEHKLDEMSECVGKMLKYGSRLMDCLDEMGSGSGRSHNRMGWRDDDDMGYRDGGMNYRDDMGNRDGGYMNNRDGGGYGERRGVPGSGRGYR